MEIKTISLVEWYKMMSEFTGKVIRKSDGTSFYVINDNSIHSKGEFLARHTTLGKLLWKESI